MQQEFIDYNEVFAVVGKHTSLKALLAAAAAEDMELHQLDIETAFLNGDRKETIYTQQPGGHTEDGPNMVCHLTMSLYGMKQAPRAWNICLKQELEGMGITASEADAGFFTAEYKGSRIYLVVYVDDILVAAQDPGRRPSRQGSQPSLMSEILEQLSTSRAGLGQQHASQNHEDDPGAPLSWCTSMYTRKARPKALHGQINQACAS